MHTVYDYVKSRGITIKDLAEAVDISQNHLYKVLRGVCPGSHKLTRRLLTVSGGIIDEKMIKKTTTVCICCGKPL